MILRKKNETPLTWVTDQLAVGSAPMSYAHMEMLRQEGIQAILNLCGEFCDLHQIEESQGFEVYYLPLQDETAPKLEEMDKALAWLDEAIYLGKRVYIHCRHGIGRTGTVLNAYFLRRGFGHRLAGRRMKKLRSQPASFEQWWTLRKYGRKSGRLTVREPSIGFQRLMDPTPMFEEHEALLRRVDGRVDALAGGGLCGRDHDECCRRRVSMSLVEAVYLSEFINATLASQLRQEIIDSALRQIKSRSGAENQLCCLNQNGKCLVFECRPVSCRTADLSADAFSETLESLAASKLDDLSRDIYAAVGADGQPGEPPEFTLPEVVSGKYVERLFHMLLNQSPKDGAS